MESARLGKLLAIFIILMFVVVAKIAYNVVTHGRAFDYAFTKRIPARNGSVYDIDGRVLAADVPEYTAYLDRDYLLSVKGEDGLRRLANALGLDVHRLKKKRFPVLMRSNLERSILAAIPSDFVRFVSTAKEYGRSSISNSSLSVYLKRVEEYYEDILKKKRDGRISYDLVSKGEKLVEPEDGEDIHLTVDMDIQRSADAILDRAVKEYRAKDGLIIVMESQTGAIKAIASTYGWPFAAQGYFEPGSSLKPVIYAIALEEGLVSTSTTFHCSGQIRPLPDSDVVIHDIDAHGTVTTVDALVESCNVASVQISKRLISELGPERYYWWLRRFGLGEPTGIDVPNETSGRLLTPSRWYDAFFAHLAIGQGIGVSGFQLIRAFNVIVTDGFLVTPHFLWYVSDGGAKKREWPKRRVISSETAIEVRKMLEEVVERGTGVKAKVKHLKVGGKTGTAQKASKNGYTDGKYYSIFLGFFPADEPEYTVLVMLDEPSNGFFGGDVAAPVFSEIVEAISSENVDATWPPVRKVVKGVVPDFRGMTAKGAQLLAEALGLDVDIRGRGVVVRQSVEPGVVYNRPVKITLECGF